jgi:hypothetical protein
VENPLKAEPIKSFVTMLAAIPTTMNYRPKDIIAAMFATLIML